MNEWLVLQSKDGSKSALIPPSWLHRNFPLGRLTEEGMAIRPEDVAAWGLRMADKVSFEPARGADGQIAGYEKIVAVNNETGAEICQARLNFLEHLVEGVKLGFADREYHIDRSGDPDMRLLRMVSPIGPSLGAVTGPSDCGKTWLMRSLTRGLMEAEPDGYFILLDIGERVPDVGKRVEIAETHRTDGNVEHYKGFQQHTAINNAIVTLNRVHRLAEHHYKVFFLLDSLWGLVLALSRMETEGGFAGKGVPVAAIEMARNFLFAGSIEGGGYLTVIATSLDEGEGSRSRVVLDEVGWQNATFKWALRRERPDVPRPWIDIVNTRSRELEEMLGYGSERYRLHEELIRRIWERGEGNPRRALNYAIGLASVPGTWDEAVAVWRDRWAQEDAGAAKRPRREERRGRGGEGPAEPAASAEGIVEARDRLADEGLDLPVIGAFLVAQIARKGYPISQVEELLREVAAGERQLSELYT